jgi:hypothetical protein
MRARKGTDLVSSTGGHRYLPSASLQDRPAILPHPSAMVPSSEDQPLYAEREDWADVTPLPQYENVNPLAPIQNVRYPNSQIPLCTMADIDQTRMPPTTSEES